MLKLLLILLFPSCLWAATSQLSLQENSTDSLTQFTETIEDFSNSCSTNCQAPYSEKTLFDRHRKINDESFAQIKPPLENASYDLAQIWGDTILEGDYVAKGEIFLDKVIALYKEQTLIGYYINYSEKAWDTSTCNYEYDNDRSLDGCITGHISEGSFVSPNFKWYFRNENQFAEFSRM